MSKERTAAIVGIHEYPLRVAPGVSAMQIKVASIKAALDVVIQGASTEEERASLANIRQTLAFFQPGVPSGRAALDALAFEGETWGGVVRTEMAQQQ